MGYLINGESVADEVIQNEIDAIEAHYESQGESVCCDREDEIRSAAQENVIHRILLQQASVAALGEVSAADLSTHLEQLKSDHGGEEQFFANTGFLASDEEVIRGQIRTKLLVDRIIDSVLGPDVAPVEEEVRAYYEENIRRYQTDEEVRLSELFKEPTSHESARETYLLMREIREKLLDGADFHEMAQEHGEKQEKEIDLGFYQEGQSLPEIEAITFSLRANEISPIVATQFGFHIFKKTGHKASQSIPFETIRETLFSEFLDHSRERKIRDFIEKIKGEATIEEVSTEQMTA